MVRKHGNENKTERESKDDLQAFHFHSHSNLLLGRLELRYVLNLMKGFCLLVYY